MAMAVLPLDGQQQLERAARLLDVAPQGNCPQGKRTPVRKSLEQMFCESRNRVQPPGTVGLLGGGVGAGSTLNVLGPFGNSLVGTGASRLLQGPQAQRLDREVADFALGPGMSAPFAGTAPASVGCTATAVSGLVGNKVAGASLTDDQQNLGVREFFALRHERVLLGAIEEAQRDCMQSLERHSFNKIQSDWEDAKAQIMSMMAPHRLGAGAVGSALRGMSGSDLNASTVAMMAPPQDGQIIDSLLREPMSLSLVQRVARLSCDSCPHYQSELEECWGIVSNAIHPTPRAVTCGALRYLQNRYATEIKAAVYGSADLRLGGLPDEWSIVQAFGRLKFGVQNFPSSSTHVWYAAYVAARAGFMELLCDLTDRAAPSSDRCSTLRPVCAAMARRLQAVVASTGQAHEFTAAPAAGSADAVDLLRADLAEEANSFHEVLVSLLLGKKFAFGRLPEGTIEDWLWYRLHALQIFSGDSDQCPEFAQDLEQLRQHVLAVPPSRYDPALGVGINLGAGVGAIGSVNPFPSGVGDQALAAAGASAAQTLNFVKVLLLTAQFGRAIQQLRSQDAGLHGPALHVALVLHRTGSLLALAAPEPPPSIAQFVCDYASRFSCADQLQYFRILDLDDRVRALQRLLLRGGLGTNDELLGYIDPNGRHRAGLLERTLHQDGLGDGAEFVALCTRAGRSACEHGQYREAIRLLHLGRCYSEVLQVICRCLRLPVWREASGAGVSEEAGLLGQDIERFFAIYERNLDRYALTSEAWNVARKLYAARVFHTLCNQGRPEAALDIFDREQLLPLSPDQGEVIDSPVGILAEQPQIVSDYVRILAHAASHGAVVAGALRARVKQLQAFLGVQSHRLALDRDTASCLASLALC